MNYRFALKTSFLLFFFYPPLQASGASEIATLTEEVKKLTATVQTYGERIQVLEQKLAEYESTVLNANSE